MANVQVTIKSLAVTPNRRTQCPGLLSNGRPCIQKELHQFMLFHMEYSDGRSEVVSGNFFGRGMARDCYKVVSGVLGNIVFKLQDASWAVGSSGMEAALAGEPSVREFVLPVLWYSDQLPIELSGKVHRWTVIVVPMALCDVEQVLIELVSHHKTGAGLGAVNNVVQAILCMFIKAMRAGFILKDVNLRNLAFDGDPMTPGNIRIRILDFELCGLGEVGHMNGRTLFLRAVIDALIHVASLFNHVSWSSCASDIVYRILSAMSEFTDDQWLRASYDLLLAPALIAESSMDMVMPRCMVELMPLLMTCVGLDNTQWIMQGGGPPAATVVPAKMPQPANQMDNTYERLKHEGRMTHDMGLSGSGSNSSAPAAQCEAMPSPDALFCPEALALPVTAAVAPAVALPAQPPFSLLSTYPVNPELALPPTLHQPPLARARSGVGVLSPFADADALFPLLRAEPVAAIFLQTVPPCVHSREPLVADADAGCGQRPLMTLQGGPFNSWGLDRPLCSSPGLMDELHCSGADPGHLFVSGRSGT